MPCTVTASEYPTEGPHLIAEDRQFVIEDRIGEGGMGVVFEAEDLRTGRKVALKRLKPSLRPRSFFLHRLFTETQMGMAVSHPNIVEVYGVWIDPKNDEPYIVMERLSGATLRDHLACRSLSVPETISLGIQAAEALGELERFGIVHGDLKPDNLFICRSGGVKLIDFGLAEWCRTKSVSRTDQAVAGTLKYLSPEKILGAPCDHRSDLFTIGVVLYQAVSGTHPFQATNGAETVRAILTFSPPPLERIRPDVPRLLAQMVSRLLDKDPYQRYSSATELLSALTALTPSDRARWHARMLDSVTRFGRAFLRRNGTEDQTRPGGLYGERAGRASGATRF